MKYAISLRSKHTGEEIPLGGKYNTIEEAQEYANKEVCDRCNYIDFVMVNNDAIYRGRKIGFTNRQGD